MNEQSPQPQVPETPPKPHWLNFALPIVGVVLVGGVLTYLLFVEQLSLSALFSGHAPGNRASVTLPEKLNVILILTDDQSFESISKMPYLSSRTDWITFDHAYENVALCCPSRSSILSGEYDTHTGVQNNGGDVNGENLDESGTLPVWLHAAGYETAMIGKYLNGWPWGRALYTPPGWDDWQPLLKPYNYFDFPLYNNGTQEHYGKDDSDYQTDVLSGKAVDFITNAKPPFFLYFAPHAPHAPFQPAPKYEDTYASAPPVHAPDFEEADVSDKPQYIQDRKLDSKTLDPATQDADRMHQWEMLLSIDDAMKAFDAELAKRGIATTTVMIFMTDNGYAHGEHRWVAKRCPYDVCAQTPLLIRYPGQDPRHIQDLAMNIDIPATIAAIAGAEPNVPQDGYSLLPLITGSTTTSLRDGVLEHWIGDKSLPAFWSVRTEQYRYTEYGTGEKELYDYAKDPYELTNKVNDPAYASIQATLATQLAALKADALAPIPASDMPPPPNYVIQDKNYKDQPDDE
jgi:arylsulfatase A-like enzyme